MHTTPLSGSCIINPTLVQKKRCRWCAHPSNHLRHNLWIVLFPRYQNHIRFHVVKRKSYAHRDPSIPYVYGVRPGDHENDLWGLIHKGLDSVIPDQNEPRQNRTRLGHLKVEERPDQLCSRLFDHYKFCVPKGD